MFKYTPLTLLLLASFSYATTAKKQTEIIEVTADRIGNPVNERVSFLEGAQLIDAEYIRAQQASTLEEALRKTTSVQVDQEGGSQGSNVIIRGLSGDQVTTRIDGIPKNFNQTRHGGANTVWIDPEIIQKITVIPGVAANLYGSGSLGGYLNMQTRDPKDIINGDKGWGLNLRQGYETNGDSWLTGVEVGTQLGDFTQALVSFSYRDAGAYEDGNGKQAIGGSSGSLDKNLLTKLVHNSDNAGDFELTYLDFSKSYTSRGAISQGRVLSSGTQQTKIEDNSINFEHNFTSVDYDWLNLNSRIGQAKTKRTRRTLGEDDEQTWQVKTDFIEIQNQSPVSLWKQRHQINVGIDYTKDDITTGYFSAAGEQAQREREILGLYASDRFSPMHNLDLVLGLRYDNFESRDLASNASSSNQGVFPKLHLDWRPFGSDFFNRVSIFGVIGKSFRAPSVHEAFGRGSTEVECQEGRRGFSCTEYVPNEELEAEYAVSYEIGARINPTTLFYNNDELYMHLVYINNELDNYISEVDLAPGSIELNGETYSVDRISYQNIEQAEIHGLEFKINYTNDHIFTALSAQKLEGENKISGENLVDISPASANFSIGAYLFAQKSRVGFDLNWRDKREVDADSSFNRLSYTVIDMFASYQFNKNWKAQVRVSNLTDKLYTKRYQSLSVDIDTGEESDISYYEPGRNIKLLFEANF
ncbi:TonB-dependent receptor domain-containing protein [Gayadomonas joobiniege]|uniref:TonB-dependent receptor domain-containing protein n=1 Tax=Gayadomonas joobiniege TaxID=1234606 RepID=UPI0003681CF6|nr:TonB-dependent receptor [Gayadomonas joobiniege]